MAGAFDYKQAQISGAPKPKGRLAAQAPITITACASANALIYFTPLIKTVLSGACTAGVLKTVLSLSGSGVVSFLAASSADTTSRTHSLKVTLDGVVIFDATSTNVVATTSVVSAIGAVSQPVASYAATVTFEPLAFTSSLLVEYASSLTETNLSNIGYRYYAT